MVWLSRLRFVEYWFVEYWFVLVWNNNFLGLVRPGDVRQGTARSGLELTIFADWFGSDGLKGIVRFGAVWFGS